MRILFVAKGLDRGGLEQVVVDIAVGCVLDGDDVAVAVANPARRAHTDALTARGVRVVELPGHDRFGLRAALALRALIRSSRPDVVHAHGPLPVAASRMALTPTARTRRIAFAVTVHTPWQELRPVSRLLTRLSTGGRTAVWAVSTAVRDSIPTRLRSRTAVLEHGVVIPDHTTPANERAIVTVVAVASHRAVKDYPLLLRAIQRTDDRVHLIAIGDGPRRASHARMVERLGLSGRVSFVARSPDVAAVVAEADIVAITSRREGQPLVLMEAMAQARPVVSTAVGRAPELLAGGRGALVGRDADSVAAALGALAADPRLRATMGASAAEYAAARLTVAAAVSRQRAEYVALVSAISGGADG